MKRIGIIIVFSILGLVAGTGFAAYAQGAQLSASRQLSQVVKQVNAPAELIIPKLNIDTSIESVGIDPFGNMDVPKDEENAGWYKYSVLPGDTGNAVMAGHLDSKTGPAIFYKLADLDVGDEIIVRSTLGQTKTFTVTATKIYSNTNFPSQVVFGPTDARRLNLITCTGVFNRASMHYNQRIVVFSELKQQP